MKSKEYKISDKKHVLKIISVSFLLALLVSTVSVWIYNNPQNDIFPFNLLSAENGNENEYLQIQWDFNSGPTLSTQLNEEINKLMFVKIDVGFRVENSTGGYHYESLEGINYNITSIEAWLYDDEVIVEMGEMGEIQRPVSGSWSMHIHGESPDCPNDIFCGPPDIKLNESENLNQLYSSFARDIANIGTFSNITHNGTEELSLLNSEIEVLYWAITHVYTDGSYMQFNIFNDIMIIRSTPLEIYLINEGGTSYGPSTNNNNSVSFKAKIEGPILPNYVDGINSLLTLIVNR